MSSKPVSEQYQFDSIANSFVRNLRALRIFNDQIGAVAAEHDRSATESFTNAFESLFPEGFFSEEEQPAEDEKTGNEVVRSPKLDEADKAEIDKILSNPTNQEALFRAAASYVKAAPVQKKLLRTSVLVSLMSYLEALIADLIHAFYIRHPEAMPAEERTLSLAELRGIGSIEEAESFLAAKEVDSVLRESLDAQFRYFIKRLKVDLAPIDEYRTTVLEVDQRRNLYVHNRGKVNSTYLERVDAKLAEMYGVKKGDLLPIKNDYLRHAMSTVEVVGIVLSQQCWRKWDKKDAGTADGFLVNVTFEGLQEERYDLVEKIAQYSAVTSFESDFSKRAVCINHAIALRDSGNPDGIEQVLGRHDWSACGLNFQVALRAVRGQEDELYDLLPRAVAAEELKQEQFETWPLFRNFRGIDKFKDVISDLFKGSSNPATSSN